MSVRKRSWTTPKGERKEAWVVDYSDRGGKRHLKTFTKKREADAYATRVSTEIGQGIHSAGKTTVTQAGELWIADRESELERATVVSYRQHLDLHIAPFIGTVRLADLTLPRVREFEDELHRQGRSGAMIKRALVSLSSILSDAQDRGLVAQNVLHRRSVKKKKNGHKDRRDERHLKVGRDIPTVHEIRSLIPHLGTAGEKRTRPLILTAMFTGLRASELRGLRWADLDLDKAELTVSQRADRYREIGAPKSKAGTRTIPLLPMVVNALREWRLASGQSQDGLVFAGWRGRPTTHNTIIRGSWHPAQIAAGLVAVDGKLPKYPGLHALRHFYASWSINRKADGGLELPIKVVQGRLGHASIKMTADTYGHLFPRGDDAAELAAAERAFLAT
jgi:integrase